MCTDLIRQPCWSTRHLAGKAGGGTRWERSTTSVDLFVFPALHTMGTTCAGHGWAQEAIRKRVRAAGGW